MLTLAANADPKLATSLLDDLGAQVTKTDERRMVLEALAQLRSTIAYFKASPDKLFKLGQWERFELLAQVCDGKTRAELAQIAQTHSKGSLDPILSIIDECISARRRFEPIFRRWLGKRAAVKN